ncbi:uncharacterized protein LOC121431859 [Lytechinus variegatus]|uniref:uncharacterized protein LOC121431859 n=1 Tax=Lytechinus variegatus TaxID=7654 RepID=UPI001BB25B72|nr:uncharacterized protein LOC121431859 [Lytechinus variegatus]XP_041485563.1 uncharacterized protein LOC121431859 [Lytechinus variegatus]
MDRSISNFKVSKPPGYREETSDEDSITPPASPTHTNPLTNDHSEYQSSAIDNTDGGGEHDNAKKVPRADRDDVGIANGIFNDDKGSKVNSQVILPVDDVKRDGLGGKNSAPVDQKKGDQEKGLVDKGVPGEKGVAGKGVHGEKDGVTNDAIRGRVQSNGGTVEENGAPPIESSHHLDQMKEGKIAFIPREGSEEHLFLLIDEFEEAMTSKEKGGSGRGLATIWAKFLPIVLCTISELTTLKDKVKYYMVENRSLQKEVRQVKRESEDRNDKDASGGTKTPAVIKESTQNGKAPSSNVTSEKPQKQAPDKDDQTTRELKKLRSQNKELQRVNHSWEKYCKKLIDKCEIDLKKKTAQLAASEERRKDLQKRLDDKFKDYDHTLLLAKRSEGQCKAAAEQYKKDRDAFRLKYDEMTTKLRDWIKEREDKDKEIQRLNKVVERQAAQPPYGNMTYVKEDLEGCLGHPKTTKRAPREMVNGSPVKIYQNLDDDDAEVTKKEKQARESAARPKSPRSPPKSPSAEPPKGNPLTLGKDELKDQIELYRQQIDVFRTDFIQERHDREKAVGQVDSLKKELEKTKKRLEELQQNRIEHDFLGLGQDYTLRLPREETKMLRGGGRHMGNGRQYAFQHYVDLPENHVYSVIED